MSDVDRAEFTVWYREVHPRLVATLAVSSGDRDLAADVADEAIARALAAWDRVGPSPSPDGWAFRTAFNELKRRHRRRKVEATLLRQSQAAHVQPTGPGGEIWHVVAELPPRQREAVALRYIAQLTEPEIAQAMSCRRGTVSSHLRAAHRALRTQLEEPRPESEESTHVQSAG